MKIVRSSAPLGRGLGLTLVAITAAAFLPTDAAAQFWQFGRNKVQYDDFDFRILTTDHFDVHFYEDEGGSVEDFIRMSERWYERLARAFQHEFEARKPLIVYANHPDFQQTNTTPQALGEGTGGFTESLKNRVVMPMTGSYADTDHVLGHELVHAFQYNIAQSRRGGGLQGLYGLPLWLVEGMAEYLSVGRDDPLTAMWMRDALRRDDFPTIQQMTREQRFFPYRFGHALWAYIGGTYGDDAIFDLFRRSLRMGFQPAIQQVLGVSADTLSAQWLASVEEAYRPLMDGRTAPSETGRLILGPETGAGEQNLAPSLSPDGRYVVFISEKDLFSVELFLANTETGEIIRRISSAASDPHTDALRFIDTSGTWSPDGEFFAFVVFADGDNQITIVRAADGSVEDRLSFDGIGAINNPAWSPDGTRLAFSGTQGGLSDLYVWNFDTDELTRLTDDKHADFHPTWSPDGSVIAFASDRGPETDFGRLTYSRYQISLLDLRTRAVRTLDLLGDVRHSNPQFGDDANTLFFLSDADGFSDVYRTDVRSGSIERVTRVATGVSGITALSPALSVAGGTVAFSIFDETGFTIHTMPTDAPGTAVARLALGELPGRQIPPVDPDRFSRVTEYLADAATGLAPPGHYDLASAEEYNSSLALDYVSQPSIGVGTDQFGNYLGGGAQAVFSDMLGNKLLGVAIQAQGTFKDIGGLAQYADIGDRWNWGVQGGRIPYLLLFQTFNEDPDLGPYIGQLRQRIYINTVGGSVAYPFSMTRRVEASAGFTRYSFDVEEDRYFVDPLGRVFAYQQVDRPDLEQDPLNLASASVALVGDNSFFGFTSPIRGGRYRFQVEGTTGTSDYLTLIADWRRYWAPDRNLTIAFRALHWGRYGLASEANQTALRPLFVGYETLIRGYAPESIDPTECSRTSCSLLDNLQGQRLGVANLELRLPLIGTEQFGIFNFPYLPTELVAFADAGVAWDENNPVSWEFSRSTAERVPVFSAGVSARFNILGFLVLESYYAYPFQREAKGPHWGFSLAPGW